MHMYLDGPNKCNPIIFKSVSRTPNITSEGETVLCLLCFPDFFSHSNYFWGKSCPKVKYFFRDFVIHKICVWSSKYGSAIKCSNRMRNYLLLAFFLFNFECRIRVELKILNWWQSQLYVILHNGCNTKQSKI